MRRLVAGRRDPPGGDPRHEIDIALADPSGGATIILRRATPAHPCCGARRQTCEEMTR